MMNGLILDMFTNDIFNKKYILKNKYFPPLRMTPLDP